VVGALNTLSFPKKLLQYPVRILELLLEKLRTIGIILKNTIRSADQAFRYGGDEFAVLLKRLA
jgi:hypothetical protein